MSPVVTDGFINTNNNLCVVVLFVMFLSPSGLAARCLHLLQLCPNGLFICWQDAVLLIITQLPAINTAFRTTTVLVLTMRLTTFNCRKILLPRDIVQRQCSGGS